MKKVFSHLGKIILTPPHFKHSVFIFTFLTITLSPDAGYGQCLIPGSIVDNEGFETVSSPCNLDGAIASGCVQGWFSANGSPSISATNAPSGVNFALLEPNNETMYANINLCPGEQYTLSFRGRTFISDEGETLRIYLANGLTPTVNSGIVPIPIPNDWQLIGELDLPKDGQWPEFTIPFTSNNSLNDQLVFVNASGNEMGIDQVVLTCESGIGITIVHSDLGNGTFEFTFDVSNPNPGVTIVDECWEFGDGNSSSGSTVQHTYTAPGTYEVCGTIRTNCGCVSTVCKVVVYTIDPCDCGDVSEVLPIGVQDWNNLTQNIDRDVIIPPGAHLRILNSTISVRSGCKFVVMRGASLRVQSSTLTSLCAPQQWGGIVVWGNSNFGHAAGNPPGHPGVNVAVPQSNPLDAPGVVNMLTNPRLEYMNRNGIHAQRWGFDAKNEQLFEDITGVPYTAAANYTEFFGGLISARTCTFHNNRLSAEILGYPHPNLSQFINCHFTRDVPIATPTMNGDEGVNIFNTNGVSFSDCNFFRHGARGITAGDAAITVRSSDFRGLFHGVLVGSGSMPTGTVGIGLGSDQFANDFVENEYGVFSNGIYQLDVLVNNFEDNRTAGVRVANESTYRIWNNNFSGNATGVELLNNTLNSAQYILCGEHSGDEYAIMVRGNCPGMTFEDNEFNTQIGDVWLRPDNGTPGEINNNQGLQGNPVYNLFSEQESINDIIASLDPSEARFFNYYPGISNEGPVVNARLIPDCDINDPCVVTHQFFNHPVQAGFADDCLNLIHGLENPCLERACLDSVRNSLMWLQQEVNAGQTQYQSELGATERQFNTDRMNLLWTWYGEGDMALVEQTLLQYGTLYDRQLLFGFYLKAGQFGKADTLLNELPQTNETEARFVGVQRINLALAQSPGTFVPSITQDSLLQAVAVTTTQTGANARMLYLRLHGEWIEPIVDQTAPRSHTGQNTQVPGAAGITLSPNPANTWFDLNAESAKGGSVRLFDVQSVRVYEQTNWPGVGRIHTAAMPNGLYFLQVSDVFGRVDVLKISIQH